MHSRTKLVFFLSLQPRKNWSCYQVKCHCGERLCLRRFNTFVPSSNGSPSSKCGNYFFFIYSHCRHFWNIYILYPYMQVLKMAAEMDIPTDNFGSLCKDPRIIQAVLEEIQDTGRQLNLNKFEIPRKIHLCEEPWLVS